MNVTVIKAFFLSQTFFSFVVMVLTYFFGEAAVLSLGISQEFVHTIVNSVFALAGAGWFLIARIRAAPHIPAMNQQMQVDKLAKKFEKIKK